MTYKDTVAEAYRLEDEGDLEGALDRMRTALQRADDPGVVATLEEHLRRPHLLQRTGRPEEARRAFERLLREGYPDQLANPSVQWIERGMIYNAMRRAFAREGTEVDAAVYEGLFYLADAYGRFLDPDRLDHEHNVHRLSREAAAAVADDMLARLDGEQHTPDRTRVADLLYGAIEQFGAADGEALLREVEGELRRLLGDRP